MIAATPIDPATSNVIPSGFGASVSVRAVRELGKRPVARPEHLVARLQVVDAVGDGLDDAGQVPPRTGGDGPFSPPIIGRAIRGQPRIGASRLR